MQNRTWTRKLRFYEIKRWLYCDECIKNRNKTKEKVSTLIKTISQSNDTSDMQKLTNLVKN